MNCMKCGREIPAGQVFCDRCLEVMAQYPVKPDTAIHLPHRQEQPVTKKVKRAPTPEEQILHWRKKYRRLLVCLLVAILLLAAAVVVGFLHELPGDQVTIPVGRNYTIDPQG